MSLNTESGLAPSHKLADLVKSAAVAQSLEKRIVVIGDSIEPTSWVVNGIIPEGVGVISGSGGIGKTSSIVPLALSIAGIRAPACNLDIELPRKVIYITEDDTQVLQILHGMREFLKWDESTWKWVKENFVVVASQRINHVEVESVLNETMAYAINFPINCQPLVVFDTASANFDLENESSNSEASLFMSVLKQFHTKHKTSIWVIAHLSKDAKGLGIDSIGRSSARGAGSWGDDAMWTALLGASGDDGKGHRVLKIGKVRPALLFDEISFEGSIQHSWGMDRFGKEVRVDYRYTVPLRSSQDARKSDEYLKKATILEGEIENAVSKLQYPSRKQIKEHINKDGNLVHTLINEMIAKGVLEEAPLPVEIKLRGRNDYIKTGGKK